MSDLISMFKTLFIFKKCSRLLMRKRRFAFNFKLTSIRLQDVKVKQKAFEKAYICIFGDKTSRCRPLFTATSHFSVIFQKLEMRCLDLDYQIFTYMFSLSGINRLNLSLSLRRILRVKQLNTNNASQKPQTFITKICHSKCVNRRSRFAFFFFFPRKI